MKKIFTTASLVCFLLFAGCKPTEQNYQNAYEKASEAAHQKAEAEKTSATGATLSSMDTNDIQVVEGDTVRINRITLKPLENDSPVGDGNVGIAVAKYSMPTNARRHLTDVKKEYPDAFLATNGSDSYYVMIKRVANVPEAVGPIRVFETSHPGYSYLGLSGHPVVVFLSK